MKRSVILTISLLFLIISSCTTNSSKEISSVVDTFFKNYDTDFRTAEKTLLTQDLSTLIEKAIAKEIFEAEKIKKSDFPSDEPLIIEGDIFTSL